MNKRQAKKARKMHAEKLAKENIIKVDEELKENSSVLEGMLDLKEKNSEKELETLKAEILKKEEEYSNSLDENLNGDECIFQELIELKNKRNKLMAKKRQVVMNSYKKEEKMNTTKVAKETKQKEEKKNQDAVSVSKKTSYASSDSKAIIDALDFTSNIWTISYHENGISKKEVYPVSYENLEMLTDKLNSTYKNTKKIDIGLYSVLSDFDKKHQSNALEAYLKNKQLHATYHLKELFSDQSYSLKERVDVLFTAYRQKKYKKAVVIKPKNSFVAPAIVGFSLMLGLIGLGASVSKNKSVNNKNNDVTVTFNKRINATSPTILAETKGIKIVEKEEKVISEQVKEKEEFKLDDNYKLDDMMLNYSYDSVDSDKVAKTATLDCEYYKPSYIVIANESQILDFKKITDLENQTLSSVVSDYQNQFGDDIGVFLNFDGYDENDNKILPEVGWTDLTKLKIKADNTTQEKINQLQELKNELMGKQQEQSNVKVKTK